MRRSVLWLRLGLVLAIARVGGPQALGNEFQVNTYTTNSQFEPAVAMDQAGRLGPGCRCSRPGFNEWVV